MLKRMLFVCIVSLSVGALSSCIFDPQNDPGPPPEPPAKYQPLTQKWHVLNNIEVAYNKRDINGYDNVLDDGFTFFLSPGDVGGEIPEQWGRETEIEYNTKLLDVNYTGPNDCLSVEMDLVLPEDKGKISWVEVTPPSGTETWYTTTIFYTFYFDTIEDIQYLSVPGAKAQFTVRNEGTEEAPRWQLVEFRDLAEL